MNTTILLLPLFFFAATVFSVAGQGGASIYISIMMLMGIDYKSIPETALACNIASVVCLCYPFYKGGHVRIRLLLPFIITSVPASYFASRISISERPFQVILACVLSVIVVRMLFASPNVIEKKDAAHIKAPVVLKLLLGLVLGLIAGIIGIGGGIILTPLLIVSGMARTKEAAITGGLFTLANSISGLASRTILQPIDYGFTLPLAACTGLGALLGGFVGAKVGSVYIRKVFAVVLIVAIARLVLEIMKA